MPLVAITTVLEFIDVDKKENAVAAAKAGIEDVRWRWVVLAAGVIASLSVG